MVQLTIKVWLFCQKFKLETLTDVTGTNVFYKYILKHHGITISKYSISCYFSFECPHPVDRTLDGCKEEISWKQLSTEWYWCRLQLFDEDTRDLEPHFSELPCKNQIYNDNFKEYKKCIFSLEQNGIKLLNAYVFYNFETDEHLVFVIELITGYAETGWSWSQLLRS